MSAAGGGDQQAKRKKDPQQFFHLKYLPNKIMCEFLRNRDHGYEEPLSEDANQFALFDVDQDGREELIVTYTSTPLYAGRIAFVLDYDEAAGAVRMEFSNFAGWPPSAVMTGARRPAASPWAF